MAGRPDVTKSIITIEDEHAWAKILESSDDLLIGNYCFSALRNVFLILIFTSGGCSPRLVWLV